MKTVLVLVLSFLSSLAYGHFIDGQDRGNGGDQCEMRIAVIRADFENWVIKGASASLKLPYGITHEQYARTMLTQMSTATVSCTETVLTVGAAEKTCLNFTDGQGTPRILCNVDRFMNAMASDQYVLIHHEYAGLAGFEVNDGEKSDYRISFQIADYYQARGDSSLQTYPTPKCSLDPLRAVSDRMATAIYENKLDCVRFLAPQLGYTEQVLVYRYEPLLPELSSQKFFILTPLAFAAALGRVEVINTLIEAGFNPNFSQTWDYPLNVAAMAGQIESIKVLVARGAVINVTGNGKIHPLHSALSNLEDSTYQVSRVYDTAKTLLALGANADAISTGHTTLSRAAEQSSLIDLLVKNGASVSTVDKYGRTALYYCRSEACVGRLVKLGVDVNATDNSGSRAIDIVATAAAVKALLNQGSLPRRELVPVPKETAP
ncbi:ankyrin repeat domain-containing protein [Bdellovibrio sp. HCB185ZH]|uniref:ankyrin repeat domain-containing protein n=1 Tax=Bdellovibrio sp. HCB185ZH TaxID=3394235 RepID=UPI0039A620C1